MEREERWKNNYINQLKGMINGLDALLVDVNALDRGKIKDKLDQLSKEATSGVHASKIRTVSGSDKDEDKKIDTEEYIYSTATGALNSAMGRIREEIVDIKDDKKREEITKMLEEYKKNSELFNVAGALRALREADHDFDTDKFVGIKAEEKTRLDEDVAKKEADKKIKESMYEIIESNLSQIRENEDEIKAVEELKAAYKDFQASISGGKHDEDKKKQAEKLMNEYVAKFDSSFDKALFATPADMLNRLEEIKSINEREKTNALRNAADRVLKNSELYKDNNMTNTLRMSIEECTQPYVSPTTIIDEVELRKRLEEAEKELKKSIERDGNDIRVKKEQSKIIGETIETVEKENERLEQEEESREEELSIIEEDDKAKEIRLAVTQGYDEKGWIDRLKQRREALGLRGLGLRHPFRSLLSLFGYGSAYAKEDIAIRRETEIKEENERIESENDEIRARNEEVRRRNEELKADKEKITDSREDMADSVFQAQRKEILNSGGKNISTAEDKARIEREAYKKADRDRDDGR